MHSVEIKKLDLNFGSVSVLHNLDLNVHKGEFLVLLGSSGCGKSTLLNCIAGLLDITDGQILINGTNVTWAEPSERGIGMVFQSYALYPQMSVEGNLSFGLKNTKMPKEEIKARVARAAEILQIEPLLSRKPAALSGGQRQRVAIGRALVRDVDVFLFDEPLSNLDAKLRVQMRLEIRELQEKLGITALYVTHDQVEAMTMADRMIVMNGGIAEQIGTPLDVYEKPQTLFAAQFIGSPAMNIFDAHIEGGQVKIRDLPIGPAQGRDGPVKLGIRPEHLVKTSDAALNASIQMSEPLGANTLLHGKLTGFDNIAITASLPGVHLLETKSFHIGFAVEPANIHLFDPETGRRLPV